MSVTDPKKRYVTLEEVRVSYKAKDDTVHITSSDPDLQAGGFHMSVKKGTQTDEALRLLMLEEGVLRVSEASIVNEMDESMVVAESFPVGPRNPGDRLGRLFTVTSASGGMGKSTSAMFLAANFEARGIKTAIFAFEPTIYASQPYTAVNIFAADGLDVTWGTVRKNLAQNRSGYSTLIRSRIQKDTIPIEFYDKIIYEMRLHFDVVIIDTATLGANGVDSIVDHIAYPLSDAIVYVSTEKQYSLVSALRWKDGLESDVEKKVRFVLNETDDDSESLKILASSSMGSAPEPVAVPYADRKEFDSMHKENFSPEKMVSPVGKAHKKLAEQLAVDFRL